MKYGKALQERSVPQWAQYNIDYDELKHLIKVNTSKDQGQAITIPGHTDTALQKFENQFYDELCNQHDRVDLFVKSKADEFSRRLREYQKRAINLIARLNLETRTSVSLKKKERLSKMETKVLKCGDDIRSLEKFVGAQRTGFQKILKKYRKWTGSSTLGARFTDDVLSNPKSFTRRDFEPLSIQYNTLLNLLRSSTPLTSGSTTPLSQSRRQSRAEVRRIEEVVAMEGQQRQQGYWNEYDNGSEVDENEPYTLYIDPDADSSFPGSKTALAIFDRISSSIKVPVQKIQQWIKPNSANTESANGERRPLLVSTSSNGYFTPGTYTVSSPGTDTDLEDDNSSSDFPAGYAAHYATFPSIADQKFSAHRQNLLFHGTIWSFIASGLLLMIATILVMTGRHRLRVEVDAGVTVGVVASLFFATLGLSIMIVRWNRCGWIQRSLVSLSFLGVCIGSGMVLVLVMGNTGL